MRKIVLALVFLSSLVFGENVKYSLTHKGKIYEYERIPVMDTKRNELMYYTGKINVIDSRGKTIFTNEIPLTPGCEGNIKPINILQSKIRYIDMQKEKKKRKYIAFCGNYNGRHSVLMTIKPEFGLVPMLDFYDNVHLEYDKDEVLRAKVYHQIYYLKSINHYLKSIKLYYPIFYTLKNIAGIVIFSDEVDSYTYKQYKNYYEKQIQTYQKTKSIRFLIEALLVTIKIKDSSTYCQTIDLLKKIDSFNIKSFLDELKEDFDPEYLISCKE